MLLACLGVFVSYVSGVHCAVSCTTYKHSQRARVRTFHLEHPSQFARLSKCAGQRTGPAAVGRTSWNPRTAGIRRKELRREGRTLHGVGRKPKKDTECRPRPDFATVTSRTRAWAGLRRVARVVEAVRSFRASQAPGRFWLASLAEPADLSLYRCG